MMNRFLRSLALCTVAFVVLHNHVSAQSTKEAKQVKHIFKHKKLANGTVLTPDSSINKTNFLIQYNANKALWDKAFAYLATTDLDNLAPGRYQVAGDSIYAVVIQGPTKTPEQAKWESHLKYIDIQCVLKGAETMEVTTLNTSIPVTNPYDPKTDNINYTAVGTAHLVKPGQILLFFPDEVHRAGLRAEGFETDKRVVLKIMAAK